MRAAACGGAAGVLAGAGAFVFLEVLDVVTRTRGNHPWLLWLLPFVGLAWGLLQHHSHHHDEWSRAMRGTAVVIAEARRPDRGVSTWQAPLVLVGTWAAHLSGASVGREGVGLQVSASLSEHLARWTRMDRDTRRLLLVAAIAGGFGAVFAVPWAGALFALEVAGRPKWRPTRLMASVVASFTGHEVVQRLGHRHSTWTTLSPGVDAALILRAVALGLTFALTGWMFVTALERTRAMSSRLIGVTFLRPAAGGAATVGLAVLFGRDHLGLSLPLLEAALEGSPETFGVPLLKALFTVVALASGFPGGEVTPLFVIGATLGSALAAPLDMSTAVAAALGMVAVFAAASGAPLASAAMAAELFGPGFGAYALVACAVAAGVNRRRRLYITDESPQAVRSTLTGN